MIPNFKEILLELSYRVEGGIPDLNKESHTNHLIDILRENGISDAAHLAQKARVYFSYLNEASPKKGDAGLEAAAEKFKNKKYKTSKGGEVSFTTAINYGYQGKENDSAHIQAMNDFETFIDSSKGKYGTMEKPKQPDEPKQNIFGKDKGGKVFEPSTPMKVPTTKVKDEPTPSQSTGKFSDIVAGMPANKNTEKQLNNTIQTQKSILDTFDKLSKMSGNQHAAEHKQVKALLEKLFNGQKLNPSEQKLTAQYIRVAEPTENNPNATKFYLAKQPGNFKSQGPTARIRIYVGAKDSSNPIHGAFGKFVRANGMAELSPSTFGGKLSTANQTYVGKDGKTKLLKDASQVKETNDGIVQSVKIGGLNIVRIDPKTAKTETERKKIEKNNRTMDEYAEKIKAGDLDFIDMDSGTIPDTPENRVIVIKESIAGMANRFKALADKALITDNETLGMINQLSNFSKKDPNQNPQEWSNEFERILSNIANHEGEPSLKEGWANYAEVFVAIREMHDNGRGTQNGKCALLPQSTTLETVDVITVSNGKGENRIVTLDGRSVKKGVGGASGLGSKARKSTYKNDTKGLIKKGVIELSESHGKPFELKLDSPLKEHQKLNSEYQQYLKQRALQLNVTPQFIKQIEDELKKGGKGASKVTSALAKVILERQKAGLDVSQNVVDTLRLRLESRYIFTELAHEAYNTNVDVQDFSNDSVLSQKEDRGGAKLVKAHKILIDSSDGIDILAYPKPEFNIGFDLEGRSRNPGAGRFHNEKKRI
jgi:hypothetical protein